MTWRTSAAVVWMRGVGRILGVNRAIVSLSRRGGYEEAFDGRLHRTILPNDCVWDVGANVGLYTRRFAEAVGVAGIVCAFEPSPKNAVALAGACHGLENVRILQVGLGRRDELLAFRQGADNVGATSRVIDGGDDGEPVQVRSGESVVAEGVRRPNVVKIDVEGFELEVLEGLGDLLGDRNLRAIGVEVHFGILAERGKPDTPGRIERLLRSHGFFIRWADSSHLLGTRPDQ